MFNILEKSNLGQKQKHTLTFLSPNIKPNEIYALLDLTLQSQMLQGVLTGNSITSKGIICHIKSFHSHLKNAVRFIIANEKRKYLTHPKILIKGNYRVGQRDPKEVSEEIADGNVAYNESMTKTR